MADIGFIGLGIMGLPMARNLAQAGHQLHVWARRPETLQAIESDPRFTVHASPAQVAAATQAVFTIVADTPDVEAVLFAEQGILAGARPGLIVIDMSTASAEATRRFAELLAAKGVDMLDAPVSGGEVGAIQGNLSIMVGGKPAVFEAIKPFFALMGKNIVHVGSHGAGQVAKACNQIVVGVTIEAVAEALTFAQAHGVDAGKVREALLGGFAGSRILDIHGRRMLEDDYRPGFKATLHAKDMRIVAQGMAAHDLTLPCTELVGEKMQTLAHGEWAESDSSALYKLLKH